jgi:hypothetical protein
VFLPDRVILGACQSRNGIAVSFQVLNGAILSGYTRLDNPRTHRVGHSLIYSEHYGRALRRFKWSGSRHVSENGCTRQHNSVLGASRLSAGVD